MVREVLEWLRDQSHKKSEEFIGITTTFLALLTAAATLAGHRAHTEEVKNQTLATDQWGFYQAKHIRAHMYGIEAETALVKGDKKSLNLAQKYLTTAIYEQCGEPAATSCRLEKCKPSAATKSDNDAKSGIDTKSANGAKPVKDTKADDDIKGCNVPVLKDSPELQNLFASRLLTDKNLDFHKRFSLRSDGTLISAVREPPGPKKQEKECEPETKKQGAEHILVTARCHQKEVDETTEEAKCFDITEIILEASIMICGIALVMDAEKNRKSAYLTIIIAVIVAATGVGEAFKALRYPVDPFVTSGIYVAAALVILALLVWLPLYFRKPGEFKSKETRAPQPTGNSIAP